MSEPLFFKRGAGLSVGEIAALTGAVPRPGAPLDRRAYEIAALADAGPADLTFLDKPKYADAMARCRAGICLMSERFVAAAPPGLAVLVTGQPHRAFVAAARALYPEALRPSSLFAPAGTSAGTVHPGARLESGVTIDPGVLIGEGAEIGSGTAIAAGAVIGPGVRIGRNCAIGPGASIVHSLIGDRVIIHAGCRIGQDGFGYEPGPKGHAKIPQVRRVIIQDGVEIGANTTVDRGGVRDTVIGEGTKIDNLVQIAHNVVIGRHCIIVSQTGISGSVVIEDYAMLGGQVGVADHAHIGAGAKVMAQSGVMGEVPAGARWAGYPAGPAADWLRGAAMMRKLVRGAGKPADQDDQQ